MNYNITTTNMKKIVTFLVLFLITHIAFAQTPWDGSITPVTPDAKWNYTVTNGSELAWIAQECNKNGDLFKAKLILITDDIDLNNRPWTPIGKEGNPFKGTFKGNWKVIKNVNVIDTNYVGLFGYVEGTNFKSLNFISNVFIENINVTGHNYVGGMAGYAQFTAFDSCYVSGGTISGDNFVGGFIGMAATSAMKDSYAKVNVHAKENFGGGFIGVYDTNKSGQVLISYCYAKGTVTGSGNNGGFVGFNNSKIRSAYTVTTSISGDTLGLFCAISSSLGEFDNAYYCSSYNASVKGIGNRDDAANDVYGVASAGLKQINQISNLNGSDAYKHWERDLPPFSINDGFPIHIWQGTFLGVNISSHANFSLSIFPNPVKNTLNIKFENVNISKIEIIDLLGKPVISQQANIESIDVNYLKSGIYFLKLYTDKETITKKFIKQ